MSSRTTITMLARIARPVASLVEGLWRLAGASKAPPMTSFAVALMSRTVTVDTRRARDELGVHVRAIEPGEVLPNGQIADCSTALKETLLEVKDAYYAHPGHAGIACAMKMRAFTKITPAPATASISRSRVCCSSCSIRCVTG